jgi:digeranylgeranylglycerophospholipid reductase
LNGEVHLNQTRDIVIVGGGISGLSAGLSASSNGAETLILERKKEIGAHVRCGEFFPAESEIENLMPDARTLKKFYAILPKDSVCNKTKTIRVHSPYSRLYEFPFDGWVLRRDVFERAIAEYAEKAGATIQTSTSVNGVKIKDDMAEIQTSGLSGKRMIKARFVIGADGFPSRASKLTYLEPYKKDENVALCIQQTASNTLVHEEIIEMYLGSKYSPGGYAWIIPKGQGEANVGVGVRLSRLKKGPPIMNYFNAFKKKNADYFSHAQFRPLVAKILPVGGLTPHLYDERVLFAGDAAGAVVATNGSGIPTGLVSGYVAGEVAAKHLKGQCDLSVYGDVLKKEVGRVIKRGYRYRRIADWFMWSDWTFEKLLRIIGTSNVAKVIQCEPIRPLFR